MFDDVGNSFRQTRVTQRSCRALLIAEALPSRLMMMAILYWRHRLRVDISRKLIAEASLSRLMMLAILSAKLVSHSVSAVPS